MKTSRSTHEYGRLGADAEQIEEFYSYLEAFSSGDVDRFTRYYTDDIVFDLGVAPPFHGKAEVVAFYRNLFSNLREKVTVQSLQADTDRLAARITVRFVAVNDLPDFVLSPMHAGDEIEGQFDILYMLRDGLIASVQLTRVGNLTYA